MSKFFSSIRRRLSTKRNFVPPDLTGRIRIIHNHDEDVVFRRSSKGDPQVEIDSDLLEFFIQNLIL